MGFGESGAKAWCKCRQTPLLAVLMEGKHFDHHNGPEEGHEMMCLVQTPLENIQASMCVSLSIAQGHGLP